MTKLVDQLVTEQLHHIAGKCEADPRLLQETNNDILARAILCEIAHAAHPAFVVQALSALGVASSLDEVGRRFSQVREERAQQFAAAGIDITAEHAARREAASAAGAQLVKTIVSGIFGGVAADTVSGVATTSPAPAAEAAPTPEPAFAPEPATTPEPSAEPSQAVDAIAAEFGSDAPPAAEPAPAPLATAVDAAA